MLEEVLRSWLGEERAHVVDGKRLRGSKRSGERALAVLTMAGQELGKVVAQRRVDAENELAAALALLEEVPLAGKVVSADAAILQAPVVQTVVEKGGPLHRAGEAQLASGAGSSGGVDHVVVAATWEPARVPRRHQQRPRTQRAARRMDGSL